MNHCAHEPLCPGAESRQETQSSAPGRTRSITHGAQTACRPSPGAPCSTGSGGSAWQREREMNATESTAPAGTVFLTASITGRTDTWPFWPHGVVGTKDAGASANDTEGTLQKPPQTNSQGQYPSEEKRWPSSAFVRGHTASPGPSRVLGCSLTPCADPCRSPGRDKGQERQRPCPQERTQSGM